MISGDYGALGQAIFASTQVKSQLDTLAAQVSTGYVSNSYAVWGPWRRHRSIFSQQSPV